MKNNYSKNEIAAKIVGLRPTNGIAFDEPSAFNYCCPVCKNKSLHWSEYNTFLWCEKCNKDIQSTLCQPDIDKAIETYLDCVLNTKNKMLLEIGDKLITDKEIESVYNKMWDDNPIGTVTHFGFIAGAKWMREKLKNAFKL